MKSVLSTLFLEASCWILNLRSIAASYLGPLLDRLAPEPSAAHGDHLIDQVEQEADRLAAALRPAHPGDLVPADAPPVDARDGAGRPSVLQRPGTVHLLHLIQHGVPDQLSEKTVHIVEAMRQQGRDDQLQHQMLQVRVRYRFDKRHFNGRGDLRPIRG